MKLNTIYRSTAPVDASPHDPDHTARNVTYGPFVSVCRAHGISRSVAYQLLAAGHLDTFLIGRRRYVLIDSLRDLPRKLLAAEPRDELRSHAGINQGGSHRSGRSAARSGRRDAPGGRLP